MDVPVVSGLLGTSPYVFFLINPTFPYRLPARGPIPSGSNLLLTGEYSRTALVEEILLASVVGTMTYLWAGFFDPLGAVAGAGLRSIAKGGANQL
jgi:hypothetical protein